MDINSQVELVTFNGQPCSPDQCNPHENYWVLIGKTGRVIAPQNIRQRVLVQFDDNLTILGLTSHNPVPNSLLILVSDLKLI
jgi:acetylornithine/N-succinyldiaminopimelate aminotransferase